MSKFLEIMKNSGIIQRLRDNLPEKDHLKFDEQVARILGEYNSMWMEMSPTLTEYQQKVESHGNRIEPRGSREPEREHRQHDESNDE